MQNLASLKKLFSLANGLYAGKPFASFYSGKYGKMFDNQFSSGQSPFGKLVVYNTQPYPHHDQDQPTIMNNFKTHIDYQFATILKAYQNNPVSGKANVLIKIVGSEFQFNGSHFDGNEFGDDGTLAFAVNTFIFNKDQANELMNHYRENIRKLENVTKATVVAYYNTTQWSTTSDGNISTQTHPTSSVESTQWEGGELIWGVKKGLLNVSTCVGSGWDGRAYKPMESKIDGFEGALGIYPEQFQVKLQEMKVSSEKCEMKVVLRTCLESTQLAPGLNDCIFEVILGSGTPPLDQKADIGTSFVIIGESQAAGKYVDGIWLHKDVIEGLQKYQKLLSPENRITLDKHISGKFQKIKGKEHTDDAGKPTLTETTLDLSFLKESVDFSSVFLGLGNGLQNEVVSGGIKVEALEQDPSSGEHQGDHSHAGQHHDPSHHDHKDGH